MIYQEKLPYINKKTYQIWRPIYFKDFIYTMIYTFFNLILILLIGILAGIIGSKQVWVVEQLFLQS